MCFSAIRYPKFEVIIKRHANISLHYELLISVTFDRAPNKDEAEMMERTPKKITVYRNGSTTDRHLILLNKRADIQLSDLLRDIGEMFGCPFDKLFTPDGKKVFEILSVFPI